MTETLVVAAVAVALALWLRPGAGLAVLIASSVLWPEYSRIPLGVVQMSVPRFVALALVLRHASRWSRLHQSPCDWLVIAGYCLSILSVLAAEADPRLVTSTIGRGLDTILMYGAARLCLAMPDDVKGMRWPLVIAAVVTGTLSMYEAVAHQQLFSSFYYASGGDAVDIGQGRGGVGQLRWGMLRSQLATLHPIYFGVGMTIVLGFVLALRQSLVPWLWWSAVAGSTAAIFFSLSAGPWTAASGLLLLLPFYRATWLVKPALWAFAFVCVMLEFLSNRHFYHMICYLSFSSATGWYRVRLLEVSVYYLPEYWLFGYGGRSFAHWGLMIDQRFFIDCVNNYILIAAMNGLFTMLCYLGAKAFAVWALVRAWKRLDTNRRWPLFVILATLIAISLAELSVSVFGPALVLNGVLLGGAVSAAGWTRFAPARLPVRSPTRSRGAVVPVRAAKGLFGSRRLIEAEGTS